MIMTSKMDKIRKAMEELNIKDNLVRISKDRFITVNTVDGEQTEMIITITSNTYEGIVKELKKELNKKQVFLVRILNCSKSTFWYKGLEGLIAGIILEVELDEDNKNNYKLTNQEHGRYILKKDCEIIKMGVCNKQ